VLLESDGYIVLADFGMSKFLAHSDERMKSFVGTLPYLAPEIVNNEKYDRTVDWWALGIMLYEMMFGSLPFQHKNQKILFDKILTEKLDFPQTITITKPDGSSTSKPVNISDEAKNLIAALLHRSPKSRLGSKNDYRDIMNHPWFNEIDKRKLLAKQIRPPYRPQYFEDS
jgi:serine/threonine protein kinase